MLLLLLLLACGDATLSPGSEGAVLPAACSTAPRVTWENWGQGFFMTRCGSCHTPTAQDRHGAPEGVDFVTHSDMIGWSDAIWQAVVVDETMPLGGGLGAEDMALLQTLLACEP